MKAGNALVPAAFLLLAALPDPCWAQARKPRPLDELIAQVVQGSPQRATYPANNELDLRIEAGGADGDAAAKVVLDRKAEILVGPDAKAMADELLAEGKPQLAARFVLRFAWARMIVAHHKQGHVAVGRLVLADGKYDPRKVLAQMTILPEGYFAAEVADLQRPVGFRAYGYEELDVPLAGHAGDVFGLGTITMKPVEPTAKLKAKVKVDAAAGAGAISARLNVKPPPVNTPGNGSASRRYMPESKAIPVEKDGTIAASSLAPGTYHLSVQSEGHVVASRPVELEPGLELDAGAIDLKAKQLGFYIDGDDPQAGELPWEKDFATAARRAKAEGKPLMVMMTATWCGPCKMLEAETLSDPWIREFLSPFIIVKAYEDKAVEKTYGIELYPTLVFTDPDGKEATRTVGYQARAPFAGVCARAFDKLGIARPPGLQELIRKKVVSEEPR